MGHFHDTLKEAHTRLLEDDRHQAIALMERHRAEVLGKKGAFEGEFTEFQKIERELRFYRTDINKAILMAKKGDLEQSMFSLKGAIDRLVEIKGHMKKLLEKDKLLGKPKLKLD